MTRTRSYVKYDDWLVQSLRADPEGIGDYLREAFEEFADDGNTEALTLAIRRVVEARSSVPKFAESINLPKGSMYHALSEKGNPRLETLGKIVKGLGYKLTIQTEQLASLGSAFYRHALLNFF